MLAVFEPGARGEAALRRAADMAAGELTVIALAPQAEPTRCCRGNCAVPYNRAVREEAAAELAQARTILGTPADFEVLVGRPDPPLAAWISEHMIDVVVMPSRRLTRGGGRLARSVRRHTAAQLLLV